MTGTVFVTVGTTKFDSLIEEITKDSILNLLCQKGYSKLILQIGNGDYLPPTETKFDLNIEVFRLKPSILSYFAQADLVISHAGAGSCLEALSAKKPLISVINDNLMDNHQTELAEELSLKGYCLYCIPSELHNMLLTFDKSKLQEYEGGNPKLFSDYLNNVIITLP